MPHRPPDLSRVEISGRAPSSLSPHPAGSSGGVLTRRRPRAFSLSEIVVVVALFGLFSTTALAGLNLTLGYWRTISSRVDAVSSCRLVVGTIANELRQGIPNPAPASTSTGYRQISPPVDPTAVLRPNASSPIANELVFTEPDPTRYDPLNSSFDPEDPSYYRTVRYYVTGGTVRREVKTWTSSGSVANTVDGVLANMDSAELRVTWRAPDLFDLEFSCTRGKDAARLNTQIFVLGK
jgi:type II secretory pathway pseudopilin PulG